MSRHAVNWPLIVAELDAGRRIRGNPSLRAIAKQIGISPSSLTRLRQGDRLDADALAALMAWLYPARVPHWVCKIPCSTCGDRLAAGVHCTECERTG